MRAFTPEQRIALDGLEAAIGNAIDAFKESDGDRGLMSGWMVMAITSHDDEDPESFVRYRDEGHLFVPPSMSPTMMRGTLETTIDRFKG